ncbi:NAD(P)-binding domain-containing protein [Paludibacterium yongneupense]
MKIGIIGAGVVGRAMAKLAVKAGHDVMLSNSRGPKSMFSLPHATGCALGTVEEAAHFGDMVVLAIPLYAYDALPSSLLAGKLVVDACNYYPERDGRIPELDQQKQTSSGLIALHFAQSHIVKAFNAIPMNELESDGLPAGRPERRALPVAGDRESDKISVAALYEQFGFDVVDAGALSEGARFERGTPAYCKPLNREALTAALAAASVPK